MKTTDRIFGWLLVVASLLHAYGSIVSYANLPVTLVWALAGALAGLLVAAVSLVRAGRSNDHAVAWLSLAGCVGWVAVALAFGKVTGNVFDPRPLTHVILGIVLAAMSIRTLTTACALN